MAREIGGQGARRSGKLPQLPRSGGAGGDLEPVRALRRFHLGAPGATGPTASMPEDALPALLAPFADPDRVRHDYPLYLTSDGDACQCRPLFEVLQEAVSSFAPGAEEARILKDNLARVERAVREALQETDAPADALELLGEIVGGLAEDLGLGGDGRFRLQTDAQALLKALPAGRLVDLSAGTPLELLRSAAVVRLQRAHRAFAERVRQLHDRLAAMLEVERGKDPDARRPEAMQGSVGDLGARFMDPSALSRVLGEHRGTMRVDADRRQSLALVVQTLAGYLEDGATPGMLVVHDGKHPLLATDDHPFQVVVDADPCAAATAAFDAEAGLLATVVRAARRADLELRSAFDADRHEAWLAELDWEGFTRDELLLLAPVVAVESAGALAAQRMLSLSRLLLSGRPVHALVTVSAAENPGSAEQKALSDFRLELGYVGVSHREAFVQQSSAARPAHLLAGFNGALRGTRAALHVLDTGAVAGGGDGPLGTYLHTGAAIEARAHPLFHYDPEAGETWARRLSIVDNPQLEEDWPREEFVCRTADDGEKAVPTAFTFADFALLEPALAEHFRPVPEACADADLAPLAEWLEDAGGEDGARRIPYVWVVDGGGVLSRVVVTRRLAQGCRDRLRFWHTLQELGGVRNEYVREATERAREEARAEIERQRQELEAAHAADLERVRQETAGETMTSLARTLLELDPQAAFAGLGSAATRPATTPAGGLEAAAEPIVEVAQPEAPEPAAEEEEDLSFDEPWIETHRCTTCNDCININSLVFVYDENKQARIGDASKGTFAQIVQAAEKCPARCIHPGKPLKPDEPGLEELIARAAPFNQ